MIDSDSLAINLIVSFCCYEDCYKCLAVCALIALLLRAWEHRLCRFADKSVDFVEHEKEIKKNLNRGSFGTC